MEKMEKIMKVLDVKLNSAIQKNSDGFGILAIIIFYLLLK